MGRLPVSMPCLILFQHLFFKMQRKRKNIALLFSILTWLFFAGCSKSNDPGQTPSLPALNVSVIKIDDAQVASGTIKYNTAVNPKVKVSFNNPVDRTSVAGAVLLKQNTTSVPVNINYENNDSTIVVQAQSALLNLTKYDFTVSASLKAVNTKNLLSATERFFITKIDSAAKFPLINDSVLLDKVQQQTFKYFWDYGHPVSGLARERSNGDDNTVTSGGSGFGIMAIPVGIKRNFITRAEGLLRMQKIVGFLKNTAQTFHGAFPHWLNGGSGVVIPFSTKDDGADLVETSYLMAGLLTARQYFNGADAEETALRNDINTLYNNVEWDWFRNGGQNVLYILFSNAPTIIATCSKTFCTAFSEENIFTGK